MHPANSALRGGGGIGGPRRAAGRRLERSGVGVHPARSPTGRYPATGGSTTGARRREGGEPHGAKGCGSPAGIAAEDRRRSVYGLNSPAEESCGGSLSPPSPPVSRTRPSPRRVAVFSPRPVTTLPPDAARKAPVTGLSSEYLDLDILARIERSCLRVCSARTPAVLVDQTAHRRPPAGRREMTLTPARRISSRARSPSPATESTARTAASTTSVSNPAPSDSRAVARTQ